jgi:hypothetical protein
MPLNGAGAASGAASGAATGASFGPWGAVVGGVIGGVAGALTGGQKKPKVATPTPISISDASKEAANANLQNFALNAKLSKRQNDFAQSEAARILEKAIPGFARTQSLIMSKINQDLGSDTELPADVKTQLQQFAAEKGIARGTSGGFNDFSLVKDFGFNLIDWKNAQRARALNSLSTVFGMAPRVNPMTPMAMFVDPNTALGAQARNNDAAYNATQAGYNAEAAAGNYNRAMWANTVSSLAGLAGSSVDAMQTRNDGVQSKVLKTPDASGYTMSPYVVNARRT